MAHVHPAPGSFPLSVSPTALWSVLIFASLLIPTASLRSLSNSIVVDVMTTERMENTDNLNRRGCYLMQPWTRKNVPLLSWSLENNTQNAFRSTIYRFWRYGLFLQQFTFFLLQHRRIHRFTVNYSQFPSKTSETDGNVLTLRILGNSQENVRPWG